MKVILFVTQSSCFICFNGEVQKGLERWVEVLYEYIFSVFFIFEEKQEGQEKNIKFLFLEVVFKYVCYR